MYLYPWVDIEGKKVDEILSLILGKRSFKFKITRYCKFLYKFRLFQIYNIVCKKKVSKTKYLQFECSFIKEKLAVKESLRV